MTHSSQNLQTIFSKSLLQFVANKTLINVKGLYMVKVLAHAIFNDTNYQSQNVTKSNTINKIVSSKTKAIFTLTKLSTVNFPLQTNYVLLSHEEHTQV